MADEPDAPDDLAARLGASGQLLVRSGIEIGRTLEAMRAAADAISAELESEESLFISRVLEVDARNGTMTISWSESKQANAELMGKRSITFNANHESVHVQFIADQPRETDFGNRSAIQLSLPKSLLAVQRRVLPRYKVPPKLPARCEISLGPVVFDARIVDVGLGGIGALIYAPEIRLDAGMIIERARILFADQAPAPAALEVRHVRAVTLADGSVANRAGCRFIASAPVIEALVRLFVTELEAAAGRDQAS